METIELQVATRELLGKKVRFLRRQDITPVHLFGHNVKSLALQCDTARLKQVLAQAGTTKLINLKLDTAKKPRTVMVREIQREACTDQLLHVDLYQVKSTEKTKVEVPVVLVGEAPALSSRDNMVILEQSSLTVECLPSKIPTTLELDLSPLTDADMAIRVKDITLDEDVTILNDSEVVVVRISIKRREKVAEEAVAEAPEAAPSPEGKAE